MGGFVCQAIALQEPKLVRKVVLIGTAPGGNPESAPPTDIVFDIALHPQYSFEDIRYLFFAEGRDKETQAYIDRRANRSLGQEPVVTPEVISKMVTLIGDFMQGQTGHFERLKDLHQPVLIVAGDRDPFFPLKNMWILYRELPNAQLSVFPKQAMGRINSIRSKWLRKSSTSWRPPKHLQVVIKVRLRMRSMADAAEHEAAHRPPNSSPLSDN